MSKRIVFFGGIGSESQFGGELTKNKEIIRIIKEYGYKVVAIDSFGSRKRPHRLFSITCKLLYNIIFHSQSTFVFSTSFGNIYGIMKLFFHCPWKLKIIYWAIGGQFADRVESGDFKAEHLKHIDLFIVEGEKMKQTLQRCGFNNVVVRPNFKRLKAIPTTQKIDDGKTHFYFLSRITPDKGVSYILNCAERLNASSYKNKYKIHFYGNVETGFEEEFSKRINGNENVEFLGSLNLLKWENYSEIAKYHFMLFPTYWRGEGFPGAVMDAFIAGTPIIASDWNLNLEIISEGKTGYIVPTHNEENLYNAMITAIETSGDVYSEMVAECRKEALKYDTKVLVNKEFVQMILN